MVLLAMWSDPLLPIPPPRPGPLRASVVSTEELPLIVLLLIVSVAPLAVGGNATAETGPRRTRVTAARQSFDG